MTCPCGAETFPGRERCSACVAAMTEQERREYEARQARRKQLRATIERKEVTLVFQQQLFGKPLLPQWMRRARERYGLPA